jgi:hypothetical protein
VISYNNLFVGTAVGFAASATLVLIARLPAHVPDASTGTFWERLPTGLRVFARTPSLRFLMAANVVVAAHRYRPGQLRRLHQRRVRPG